MTNWNLCFIFQRKLMKFYGQVIMDSMHLQPIFQKLTNLGVKSLAIVE